MLKRNLGIDHNVYKVLFEASQFSQLLIDANSLNIVHANPEACKMYQYSLEEFTSLNYKNICAMAMTYNEFNYLIYNKRLFSSIHRSKDNSNVSVELFVSNIVMDNNEYLLFNIYQNDSTNPMRMLLTDVFYNSSDAIALLAKTGEVMAINNSFTNIFGYTQSELMGNKLDEFIFPDEFSIDMNSHYEEAFKGKIVNLEDERQTKDKKKIYFRILFIPYYLGNEVMGAQVVYHDISDSIQQAKELSLFKEIIQNTSDGVLIADENREIIWVNKSYQQITGYTAEDVITKNPNIVSSGLNPREFYKMMWKTIITNGEWQGEIWNKKKDGTLYPQWLHIFVIKDKNNQVKNYVGIFKDLSEINSVSKKLLLLLEKDPLTSVYNRTYFIDKLKQSLMLDDQKSYVLFLDINGFKELNDNYGHQVGDLMLVEFAKRLLIVFENASIARYGGDEFIIHLKGNATRDKLVEKINKFSEYIQTDIIVKNINFKLTSSIGIAEYPQDGVSAEELIEKADKAMYQAKHSNSGYCFYSEMKL